MTIELLVNVLARAALGILSSMAASFLIWRFTEALLDAGTLGLGWFFLVNAILIGTAAAIPTNFAWWNTQTPSRILLIFVILTFVTAIVSAWVVNEIRGVETSYALFEGVRRIPVFSLSHMFVSMMLGAVFAGNAVAAAFYIYRALRHRES